jgi:hypothetical protein
MGNEWKTSKEWADQPGLTVTGFSKRVKRGKFERDGRLYRPRTKDALFPSDKSKIPMTCYDVIEHLADIACREFHDIELRYMSDAAQAKWRRVASHTLAAAEGLR